MLKESCFDPALVFLDVQASTMDEVFGLVSDGVAALTGAGAQDVRAALAQGLAHDAAVSIGHGVALPHAGVEGLTRHIVPIVRLAQPIELMTIDKVPVDLLFVPLVPQGKAELHLNVLAHMARLLRSQVFIKGLREAQSAEAVMGLIAASEARLAAAPQQPGSAPALQLDMVFMELTGEQAVDRLLIDLVEEGFEDAVVIEAQHLREVMAESLPLFAGFRKLFDDPGGCRVFMISCPSARTEALVRLVQQACEQGQSEYAQITVVPARRVWSWTPSPESSGGGH